VSRKFKAVDIKAKEKVPFLGLLILLMEEISVSVDGAGLPGNRGHLALARV